MPAARPLWRKAPVAVVLHWIALEANLALAPFEPLPRLHRDSRDRHHGWSIPRGMTCFGIPGPLMESENRAFPQASYICASIG